MAQRWRPAGMAKPTWTKSKNYTHAQLGRQTRFGVVVRCAQCGRLGAEARIEQANGWPLFVVTHRARLERVNGETHELSTDFCL